MTRFPIHVLILWLCCLSAMLAACDPIKGDGRGEKPEEPNSYGELIGTFFVEGRNMHLPKTARL